MRKKHSLYILMVCLGGLTLISCKQELEPQDSSPAQESVAPAQNQAPQASQVNSQPTPAQPTGQQVAAAPVTVGKGMNPAHGQPGHRCDIAVGAPLNSAPAQPQATQNKSFTVTPAQVGAANVKEIKGNTAQLTSGSTKTAPGMNPPHGQPGHRCDIAVGAPLNSTPTPTPAVNATPAPVNAVPAVLTPAAGDTKAQ